MATASTTKIKSADIIYQGMITATPSKVAEVSSTIMNSIQNEEVQNQVLGLASSLICLLDQYGLSYIDALAEANNIVYSDEGNNMLPMFKSITELMKKKWELN